MSYCYRFGYTRTVNEPPIWLSDNIIAYYTNSTSCVMTNLNSWYSTMSHLEVKLLIESHILSSHDGIFDKKIYILSFHGVF